MLENPKPESGSESVSRDSDRSWYNLPGPDADVVVSSRIRLARNLVEYPFPDTMPDEAEEKVRDEIVEAFLRLPDPFNVVYLDRISPVERDLLLERHIVTIDFLQAKGKAVLLGPEERVTAMVNERDHLRIASIRSGLSVREAYAEVDQIDSCLEERLNFAASLEWGYLNASFSDIGTGMRASVMVHLPAMVADDSIPEVLKTTRELGFRVKGYPGEEDKSLGDIFQLSNAMSLGASEVEILERVEMMAREMVEAERKARAALLQRKGVEIEDRIYRSLGVLRYARTISSLEAIELLAQVRWGISLGLIRGTSLEEVTSLLFRTQSAHTKKLIQTGNDETNRNLLDFTRAGLIRKALGGA